MGTEPWRTEPLPAETVAAVRAHLRALVDAIVTAVRDQSPVYGEVLVAPEGLAIRVGIEQAIRAFLDAVEDGGRPARETDELWRRLGEAEFQSGRRLDDLRSAFRIGTRAAWRGAAELALDAGVSAPIAIATAEAIFVYADELAADVVEGYLRMQSDEAGELERRRRRVAALLLDPEGHDPGALARAAELARWPLPRALAVIALEADAPPPAARHHDLAALAGADAGGAWLIVPDPDGPGRSAALARALIGPAATGPAATGNAQAPPSVALGPTVAPADAARSLQWARMALELAREGVIAADGLVRAGEHLPAMVIHQDRALASALADHVLAPLDALSAAERARLRATLRAWLDHQRHTPQVAAELHVHPQTVRYRMNRLSELLGNTLQTPEGRFALALALRAAGPR